MLSDKDRLRMILKDQSCAICLDELIVDNGSLNSNINPANKLVISPCHDMHAFHENCMMNALNFDSRCPCCRMRISKEFIEYLD